MAYKQPRVPPMRENTNIVVYIRELVLFLKDFCAETWTEHRRLDARTVELLERVRALEEQKG